MNFISWVSTMINFYRAWISNLKWTVVKAATWWLRVNLKFFDARHYIIKTKISNIQVVLFQISDICINFKQVYGILTESTFFANVTSRTNRSNFHLHSWKGQLRTLDENFKLVVVLPTSTLIFLTFYFSAGLKNYSSCNNRI